MKKEFKPGEIEVWKDIPGHEGIYQASSLGRIRSINVRGKDVYILRNAVSSNGYFVVNISSKTSTVHRFVAKAFIPNPENKPCVNHKDSNRLNNKVDNLEWCTHLENLIHSLHNGRAYFSREDSERAVRIRRKPVVSICVDTNKEVVHKSITDCALYLGRNKSSVSRAHRNGCLINNHFVCDEGRRVNVEIKAIER